MENPRLDFETEHLEQLEKAFNDGYEKGKADAWTGQTVYGYPIQELLLFASLCRDQGITPEKMHEYYGTCEAVAKVVWADVHKTIQRSIDKNLEHINSINIYPKGEGE